MNLIEVGNEKKVAINPDVIASVAPWVIGGDVHTQIVLLAHDPGCSMPIRYEIDEPYESVMKKLCPVPPEPVQWTAGGRITLGSAWADGGEGPRV